MRGDKKAKVERIIVLVIAFVFQFFWFFVVLDWIATYAPYAQLFMTLASAGMILYLVNKDESPAYRISWIIIISLFPVFGGVLYLLMGNKRPTKGLHKSLDEEQSKHRHELDDVPSAQGFLEAKDKRLSGISHYVTNYANMPVYSNTQVDYFANGESMMPILLRDLRAAKSSIFMEFFIVEPGVMFDALMEVMKEKAEEGLDVRFLYDDFGSITRLPKDFDTDLEKIGIKALKFNPVKPFFSMAYNTRDHRKYVVIDSEIAYTGGLNIADEYINEVERFGYWKDNMIRMQGPATWNITNLFLNMWNAFKHTDDSYEAFRVDHIMEESRRQMTRQGSQVQTMGFVQPFGDSPLDTEPIGENVYREILNNAKDYVYIYTPYLVISYELQTAMQLAAKRGVKIKLMTPGIPDKKMVFRMTRSFYRPLLQAGIEIYEFSPGFLHAKTFVSDDVVATVGTINLDYRSLYLHFETSTLMYYHPVIKDIKADFEQTVAQSKRVMISDIKTGLLGGLWDAVLRLIAPFV